MSHGIFLPVNKKVYILFVYALHTRFTPYAVIHTNTFRSTWSLHPLLWRNNPQENGFKSWI